MTTLIDYVIHAIIANYCSLNMQCEFKYSICTSLLNKKYSDRIGEHLRLRPEEKKVYFLS